MFCSILPLPPSSTLFPYTTLFRSATLKAAYGLRLEECERKLFAELAGAREPPLRKVKELVVVASRRSGKGRIGAALDRKSTRLNSSHLGISYAVFCLKKKTKRSNN